MKHIIAPLLLACLTLFSCSPSSPEENFSQAVLNCNLLYGFAGSGMQQELSSPSEKLVNETTGATTPMKRKEVLEFKLQTIESSFKKIKKLSVNEDNTEMVKASIALYEFVLPVYKTEYQQLAALYDNGAAKEKIEAAEKNINEKYETRFLALYNTVQIAGKNYAKKHGMVVREVDPSPANL